jgi:hypothetical protein
VAFTVAPELHLSGSGGREALLSWLGLEDHASRFREEGFGRAVGNRLVRRMSLPHI